MFNQPVVYVDIETSGSSSMQSKIIEIAVLRVENGEITEQFHSLISPGAPLPYWITKITGIKDSDLIDAPYFDEIADQLNNTLNGAMFIAHNVRFDYSFIKRQLEACGYKFRPKLLCTVRLSRALYPEIQGHSLEKIIERHGITVNNRHRAFDDAKAIKDFAELAYQEHGDTKFSAAVALQLKNQTIPPNLKQSALNEMTDKTGVYIYEDLNGRPLYIGKSKQIRGRLQSHFSQDTRNSKEMKLSQTVHNIKTIQTSSELEALLLEAKLVKELLPIHNYQLRRQRELTILTKNFDDANYINLKVESVKNIHPENIENVYGVYTSRKKARNALEIKLRTFSLCPKLTGLEKSSKSCFAYQLGKCRGACLQEEDPKTYNRRVEIAMQKSRIENWPYEGAVSINDGEHTSLVVNRWVIIGRTIKVKNRLHFKPLPSIFDIDTYKILRGYLARNPGNGNVIPYTF